MTEHASRPSTAPTGEPGPRAEEGTRTPPTVCVFTPTYERAYILPVLYKSLVAQTSQDFVWLIVDDGSTDSTEELVRSWIEEGRIAIDYVRTENGGKPRAINVGVERTTSPLFFVVDSDDWLVLTAIEHVLSVWRTIEGQDRYAGIVALRGTDETTPMDTWMPRGAQDVKYWDLFETMGFRGDTSLIHRTEVLRDYPYDVAPGEIFIAETSVYYRLDEHYDMLADNTILTICHYLPDGLTHNFAANAKRNPIGYWKHKRYCAQRSTTLRGVARETLLYLVGCRLAGQRGAISMAPNKAVALACYLPALVARHTIFR
ncbi:glycosyltransferase family 2 protein [Actinomyces bowdenii]|uniref:glycosyltransferase family 2 protein n=1 Tax=Actinomyces bowdenii TaxID=131109 RepID=UPI00214B7380|nr:glycosyltransferase family A protein [Actinomyces bowdenii]MCR2053389.1 glycosyltransferase family 2 protein [Actinomyces bowdenii]